MKKLLVLFIGLFVMVNGAVFAQDSDDTTDGSQDIVISSVSTSAYYAVPTGGKHGEIQPMQVNGGIEARAELWWGTAGLCTVFNCWMQGKAITQVINGSGTFNLCARVDSLIKSGTNLGGSGQNCGTYTVGGGVSSEKSENGDPRGNYWVVNTWHSAIGYLYSWTPSLSASVQL